MLKRETETTDSAPIVICNATGCPHVHVSSCLHGRPHDKTDGCESELCNSYRVGDRRVRVECLSIAVEKGRGER